MKQLFPGLLFPFLIFGCGEDENETVGVEIPFDAISVTYRFEVDDSGDQIGEVFAISINDRNFSERTNFYHYEYSGTSISPDCTFLYNSLNQHSGELSCSLTRKGLENPNDMDWPESLMFQINFVTDLDNVQVESSSISFPDFDQQIDMTNESRVSFSTNVIRWLSVEFKGEIPKPIGNGSILVDLIFMEI